MNFIIGLIVGIIVLFLIVAMYCALIVADRSDEQANMENNEGANDLFNKKICPRCKTGKYNYDLDPKSDACPYIGYWRRNKCSFYKPLEKAPKNSILSGLQKRRSVISEKSELI